MHIYTMQDLWIMLMNNSYHGELYFLLLSACIYTYIDTYMHVLVLLHVRMYVLLYVCTSVCMYVLLYVFLYVCMHSCYKYKQVNVLNRTHTHGIHITHTKHTYTHTHRAPSPCVRGSASSHKNCLQSAVCLSVRPGQIWPPPRSSICGCASSRRNGVLTHAS